MRIRSQLLVPVFVLLLGIVAISLTTALAAAAQARREIESRLRDVARSLVEQREYPLVDAVLRKLRSLSGAEYLLVRKDGSRHSSSDALLSSSVSSHQAIDDWQALQLRESVTFDSREYLCAAIRLKHPHNDGDVLHIFYPESLWRDARWQAIRPSLLLGIGVGVLAVGLSLFLSHRLSDRIHELERRTRHIAQGDFSPMPLPQGNDELRELAHSVNEMAQQLARLQRTIEQSARLRLLGQVSGGLAHQMRNGLTGARLAVQLYLHEANSTTDATPLEVALRQLTLLETHVRRFLALGQSSEAKHEPCDLVQVIDEVVELLGPKCRHAGIELMWQQPSERYVLVGDEGQLQQLVVNLVSNAIEAAGPGGRVEVSLSREGSFRVWDSGLGPSLEVQERLFEPFITSKSEGVGLGLAVAKEVAQRHGGRIGWFRAEGRTCFHVNFAT
jgi:signal transduction histidine kinase